MEHFAIGRWADFVRGAVRGTEAESMGRHLAAGCERCATLVSALTRVVDDARQQARAQPPEHAVRWVRAYFSLQRPAAAPDAPVRELRLAYDTALSPVRAGVRDGDAGSRELRFESRDYALVVSLQTAERSDQAVLAGQLTSREGEPLSGIPAGVLIGDELVGNTHTSETGFFELDLPPELPVELRLMPSPGTPVRATIEGPE